jgi:hypothetical protein
VSSLFSTHSTRRVVRQTLALVFTLLLGLCAPLAAFVRAQTVASPDKGQYVATEVDQAFVIYQTPDGDVICRDANAAEAREINRPSSVPLHRINHLKDGADQGFASGVNANATSAGLHIVLNATAQLEANQPAKQAFIAAAAKWEALISDPITVTIDVDYGTTAFGTAFPSSNVLGLTSSSGFLIPYSNVRSKLVSHANAGEETTVVNNLPASNLPTESGSVTNIFLPPSQLSALGISVGSTTSPRIGFNSNFGFDFDPSDGVSIGLTDFDSVAVHEIGHALGFVSEAGDNRSDASIWDFYRFKPGAASNANFSTAARAISAGATLTDRRVQFNGNTEVELSTGDPSGVGGDGNQSSHWKHDTLNGGVYIGIMDPALRRGEHKSITANDVRALDFFGYNVGQFVAPPAPANDNFSGAQQISGATGSVTGANVGATKEANEPSHSPDGNVGGASVWYRWQAPASGTFSFTTDNPLGVASNFDTVLAVYTGSSVGALTVVAKNDDISSSNARSTVQFNAVAGTTYQIAVDGYNADEGNIVLGWNTSVIQPTTTTIQFAAPSLTVSEMSGHADVTITRTGILSNTNSIIFKTLDNPAAVACNDTTTAPGVSFARCDYATTFQTVTFAPNETSKTVSVPLIDDSYGEPDERVTLALVESFTTSIGILGSQKSMTLVVTSNEAPGQSGTNPFFDPTFFVRQQYLDFLSREPDAGGSAAWVGTLNGCASGDIRCDRAAVSAGFFQSPEFASKGRFIFNFYKSSLGRLPTYAEFVADMSNLNAATPAELVAKKAAYTNAWAMNLDFSRIYGGMTNTQFVNTIMDRYGIASIRTPNPASPDDASDANKVTLTRADLVNRLSGVGGTLTQVQVVRAIATSDEVSAAEFNPAFVAMQYFGYLRRDPEPGGYADWLRTINANPNDIHSMVSGFVNSPEYKGRFGPQ